VISVSNDDFLWFLDHALDGMVAVLRELGDDMANDRPDLPGANSPYAIVTHCLGVMEYWGGSMVAGREIERDREAEFRARGPVAPLILRTAAARRQLEEDISALEPAAPPRNPPHPRDLDLPFGTTQGGVLLHIMEELTQHLGQMELTRDVLVAKMSP
jgi:hypothetical protein